MVFLLPILIMLPSAQPDRSVVGPPGVAGPEGPRGPQGEAGRDGRDVSPSTLYVEEKNFKTQIQRQLAVPHDVS